MKKRLKNNGISLISLVVAVSIMIIISGLLIYNAKTGIKVRNLNMMRNDIELLDDKVNAYYVKYAALPISIKYNVSPLPFESAINPNDSVDGYYVLDLSVFEGLTLNYGSDYNKVTEANVADNKYKDLYVINEQSHQIYYVRGIELDGVKYYTNGTAEEVALQPIIENELSIENCIYRKDETGYEITLKNITYNGSYHVKYKEANESTYIEVGNNITTSDYTFSVDKYGLYYIQIQDERGKTKEIINSVYADATINADEKVTMVKTIEGSSITTEEVSLVKGFTISGVESECAQTLLGVSTENEKRGTIDDGIVIYLIDDSATIDWNDTTEVQTAQQQYDQFVWVPAPNAIAVDMNDDEVVNETDIDLMIAQDKYPMAIAIDDTNYRGVLYDFNENGGILTISDQSWSSTSTGYREPAYLEDGSWADGSDYNDTEPKISQSLLQSEFNEMVNKVSNNKGFWVGRYETSNMTSNNTKDKNNKIKVVRGATSGVSGNSINWYRMYAQQKAYRNLTEISSITTSSMIWGSQWDQIMIWMKDVPSEYTDTEYTGKYYITNSVGMGNFGTISGIDDGWSSSSPAPTGFQDIYKVKNVFDLAGNIYEWTLEANDNSFRTFQGGYYLLMDNFETRAGYRGSDNPDRTFDHIGTRATLY